MKLSVNQITDSLDHHGVPFKVEGTKVFGHVQYSSCCAAHVNAEGQRYSCSVWEWEPVPSSMSGLRNFLGY